MTLSPAWTSSQSPLAGRSVSPTTVLLMRPAFLWPWCWRDVLSGHKPLGTQGAPRSGYVSRTPLSLILPGGLGAFPFLAGAGLRVCGLGAPPGQGGSGSCSCVCEMSLGYSCQYLFRASAYFPSPETLVLFTAFHIAWFLPLTLALLYPPSVFIYLFGGLSFLPSMPLITFLLCFLCNSF